MISFILGNDMLKGELYFYIQIMTHNAHNEYSEIVDNIDYSLMTKTEFENYNITHFTNDQLRLFVSMYLLKHPNTEELDLSRWDTSNITSFFHLFHNCRDLKVLRVGGWHASGVVNMSYLFCNCVNLTRITGLETWDISKVEDMTSCFQNCSNICYLSLPWNMSSVKYLNNMFFGCHKLNHIYYVECWDLLESSETNNIFTDCFNLKHVTTQKINELKVNQFLRLDPPSIFNITSFKELFIMLFIALILLIYINSLI